MKKFGLLCAGIALVALAAGCSHLQQPTSDQPDDSQKPPAKQAEGEPIKIGFIGPLTGDVANLGQDTLKATQLAIAEVNAEGGISGKPLELIAEDGACNAKASAEAGNKLINLDKIPVILGGLCSGETNAFAPTAEQNKVVVLSPCSSAPNITQAGDYIFRTYPSDTFQGKFAAEYAYNTLGKKQAAVLAVLGDYGQGIKNTFMGRFKELGGTIVLAEDYNQESRDLRTELTKIKAGNADMIYFIAYTEAGIVGLKQAKELGLTIPVLSGDALDDPKVHENSFAEGLMYTVPSAPLTEEWKQKVIAAGGNPTLCTPYAYNNVKIIADIMNRVGTDATAIKDELYKVKDYPGVSGPVTIDENGDLATATYDVKIVKNGKAEVMKTDADQEAGDQKPAGDDVNDDANTDAGEDAE
ncbi:MAG: Extracellular ligand-binding receptor [Parcubacteria group bacterium GW2011_GWA2_44_12]|nr:MAG: Extracellular ligand-binding receptor [Parcubacteria group bacterium GW2011_GWA2_44_12]